MIFWKCFLFGHQKNDLISVNGLEYGSNVLLESKYNCGRCGVEFHVERRCFELDVITFYEKRLNEIRDGFKHDISKIYDEIDKFKQDPLNRSLPNRTIQKSGSFGFTYVNQLSPVFSFTELDHALIMYRNKDNYVLKKKRKKL